MKEFDLKNFSKTSGNKVDQPEVLCNYQLAEDISISTLKTGCESLLEEPYDQENRFRVENALRSKRDEPERDINLPPGYSIYKLPKPDKSPMDARFLVFKYFQNFELE